MVLTTSDANRRTEALTSYTALIFGFELSRDSSGSIIPGVPEDCAAVAGLEVSERDMGVGDLSHLPDYIKDRNED